MLYYENDHIEFQKEIASAIAEAIINEMFTMRGQEQDSQFFSDQYAGLVS